MKVNLTLEQAMKAQRSGGIPVLGARQGWVVNATPRSLYTRGNDTLPIVYEFGWASGQVCSVAYNVAPHRDSIPGLFSP